MKNIIARYRNGNYNVIIMEDGTKIRYNNEDKLIPSMPESMDLKITNQCDMGCPMCHEGSTINGRHGDILNAEFLKTMHPYTEIAIGGGNPLQHPDLIEFLKRMKKQKMIPSMTVHQNHFMKNLRLIHYLIDNKLIYGLGISLNSPNSEFIKEVQKIPNAVIHVINGIISVYELQTIAHHNLKILILGYKTFRRGKILYEKSGSILSDNALCLRRDLKKILDEKWFNVVSFDNLAIEQLNVKSLMSEKEWEEFYMGDDGTHTMFVDLVNKTYSISSTTPIEERHPLEDSLNKMFSVVREDKRNNG